MCFQLIELGCALAFTWDQSALNGICKCVPVSIVTRPFLIGSENIERLVKAMPTGIGRIKWRSLASLQFSDDKHREEEEEEKPSRIESVCVNICSHSNWPVKATSPFITFSSNLFQFKFCNLIFKWNIWIITFNWI